MGAVFKAAALALCLSFSAGASFTERDHLQMEAAWARLSSQQRQVIELVAKDIWHNERDNRGVPYLRVDQRLKNALRADAMVRLGFEPAWASGTEV